MTQRGRKKIEDYRRKPLGAADETRTRKNHPEWRSGALPIELQQHIWSWWRNLNP